MFQKQYSLLPHKINIYYNINYSLNNNDKLDLSTFTQYLRRI